MPPPNRSASNTAPKAGRTELEAGLALVKHLHALRKVGGEVYTDSDGVPRVVVLSEHDQFALQFKALRWGD